MAGEEDLGEREAAASSMDVLLFENIKRKLASETDPAKKAELQAEHDRLSSTPALQSYLRLDEAPPDTGTQASGSATSKQRLRFWVPTGDDAFTLMTLGRGRGGESHTGFSVITSENHFTRAGGKMVMQSGGWSLWQSMDTAHILSHENVVIGANGGVTVGGRGGVNIIAGLGRTNPVSAPKGPDGPEITVAEDTKDQYDKVATSVMASVDAFAAVTAGLKGAKDVVQSVASEQKKGAAIRGQWVGLMGLFSAAGCTASDWLGVAGAYDKNDLFATKASKDWVGKDQGGFNLAGINLFATNGIVMATPTWIGMYGAAGITIGSLFNLIYGLDSSMWGVKSAAVESLFGDVTISAKKQTTVEGKKDVVVRSLKKGLTLVGKTVDIGIIAKEKPKKSLLLPPTQANTKTINLMSTDEIGIETETFEAKLSKEMKVEADNEIELKADKKVVLQIDDKVQIKLDGKKIVLTSLEDGSDSAVGSGMVIKKDFVSLGAKPPSAKCGFESTASYTAVIFKGATKLRLDSSGAKIVSGGTIKLG